MSAAGADDYDDVASADRLQALHFRSALVEERERIIRTAAKYRDELVKLIALGMTPDGPSPQSQIHSLEADLRYIDGLITRIDRRFSHQIR